MTANPFEQLAEQQISSPVKAKRRVADKRRSAQAEKELQDESKLLTAYRKHRKARIQAVLAGPHGPQIAALVTVLRGMTLESAPELIGYVRQATWIKEMEINDRFVLLSMIGEAIRKVREKAGLEPYDDGNWGQPPKAFETIKQLMELN